MSVKITKKTSLKQLASLVAHELRKHEIETVLTGGAVVSIYTSNKYQSHDLDFISSSEHKKIKEAMRALGFDCKGKTFFHPKTDFTVEFPTGPLAIGDELVEAKGAIKVQGRVLKLLSPTQCVMDRLAAYYYFRDPQALEQALLVAHDHPIKLAYLRSPTICPR